MTNLFTNIPDRMCNLIRQVNLQYYLPSPTHFSLVPTTSLPTFDVQRERANQVLIKFDIQIPLYTSAGSSINDYGLTLNKRKTDTFNHDFTFDPLCQQTDKRLDAVFGKFDADDKLTPDMVEPASTGYVVVIEFTTIRHASEETMRLAFRSKVDRYEKALRARSSRLKVIFGIIVVSSDQIYTNVPLTQLEMEELTMRYRLSQAIYEDMVQQHFVHRITRNDTTENTMRAMNMFNSIPFNWEKTARFPVMNKQMYQSWLEPPDKMYVANLLTACDTEAFNAVNKDNFLSCSNCESPCGHTDTVTQHRQNVDECNKRVYDYEHTIKGSNFDYSRQKAAVAQVPLWFPNECHPNTSLKTGRETYMGSSENVIFNLFSEAFDSIDGGCMEICEEDPEQEMLFSQDFDGTATESAKQSKYEYRKFRSNVNQEDWESLAVFGIGGKKMKENFDVVEKRGLSKKSFPLDINVQDIDDFINNSEFLFINNVNNDNIRFNAVKPLIELGYSIHSKDCGKPWIELYNDWSSSLFGTFCSMVTDIGVELTLSARKTTKPKEFILKKLRYFDVFMMIYPTQQSSHIFVSFLCFKSHLHDSASSYISPFKFSNDNDVVMWTDFVSFNTSKLRNLIECESQMFNMFCFFMELNKKPFWLLNPFDPDNSELFDDVYKMTSMCLLVLLNDKTATEEIITNMRYSIMEGFVTLPTVPKPHKMIDKLPIVLRSRLQSWLVKKSLKTMQRIVELGGFYPNQVEKACKWTNMFNPFTGKLLSDTHHLISLFYLGYLKNKEESAEKNASSALYGKILEYEDKRPAGNKYLGMHDPPIEDTKFHEFSPSFIKVLVDFANRKLMSYYGPYIQNEIELDILNEIGRVNMEDMSTLKATSKFNEEWYLYDKSHTYHRGKVIQSMRELIAPDKTHLVHLINESLDKIEEQSCMHICLFRKPQHGGLREIYVLGIHERIVQRALEGISRAICKKFTSETLMNPKNKMRLPGNHYRKAAISSKHEPNVTLCTSDDAQKWNQGHFVSKFALMLCLFTKPYMHPFIIRACSMFLRKRIMIDPNLMNIISNHDELITSDKYLKRMSEAFWGRSSERWMSQNSSYIETETGMMQGILHYTSSLFHTIYNEFLQSMFIYRLSLKTNHFNFKAHPLVTVMQSSDDSSVMITIPMNNDSLCMFFDTAVLFKLKHILGRYIGIYSSVKSTSNTAFLMEFNSEFHFYKDIVRPTSRWVISAVAISEQESIASRQEELSSNITNIISGGGSFSLAACCQLTQALLSYQMVGWTVSSVFDKYVQALTQMPDPSLGFFLFDNPRICGLSGFKYNLWRCLKKSDLSLKYKLMMTNMMNKRNTELAISSKEYRVIDSTVSGAFVQSVIISWGDRKKWRQMVDEMNLPDDYEDQLNLAPDVLYRRPETGDELLLKIALKMHSSSVAKSLEKGNTTVKVMSSAAYIISRLSLTNTTTWYQFSDNIIEKTCLINELNRALRDIRGINYDMTNEDYELIFAYAEDYEHLDAVTFQMNTGDGHIEGAQTNRSQRRVNTNIQISESTDICLFTPEKLVMKYWFDFDYIASSETVKQRQWNKLKQCITWICDTPKESLEQSPFINHSQLRNFLARMDTKQRVVSISGAPIRKRSGLSNLVTASRQHFFPGWEFKVNKEALTEDLGAEYNKISHTAFLLCNSYCTNERITQHLTSLFQNSELLEIKEAYGLSRRNSCALLQMYMQTDDKRTFFDTLQSLRLGMFGGWINPRGRMKNKRYLYPGLSKFTGRYDQFIFTFYVDQNKGGENQMKAVTVNTSENIQKFEKVIKSWCARMNVLNTTTFNFKPDEADANDLYCRMKDFKQSFLVKQGGCQLYVIKEKTFVPDPDLTSVELEHDPYNIRLIMKYPTPSGSTTKIPIFKFTLRPDQLSDAVTESWLNNISSAFTIEPNKSWLTFQSAPFKASLKFINNIRTKSQSELKGVDKEKATLILKKSFSRICSRNGYMHLLCQRNEGSGHVDDISRIVQNQLTEDQTNTMTIRRDFENVFDNPEIQNMLFLTQESIERASSMIADYGVNLPTTMHPDLSTMFTLEDCTDDDMFSAIEDDLDAWFQDREKKVLSSHPFLEGLIADLDKTMGYNMMCELFSERKLQEPYYKDLAKPLAFLMGLDEDGISLQTVGRYSVLDTDSDDDSEEL